MGPRTKKSPTSPAGKRNDVEPNMEAPEGGSASILPPDDAEPTIPVPLLTIDADAIHRDMVVAVTERALEEHALPLVETYWRLRRPGEPRVRPGHGPTPALEPILDADREEVGRSWAVLSSWAPRPIYYAPAVPIDALHRRFPFARPRSAAGVIRLLTLHEIAHHMKGHCGLSLSLNAGSREELSRRFAEVETEADKLTATFWRLGLSERTVRPHRRGGKERSRKAVGR